MTVTEWRLVRENGDVAHVGDMWPTSKGTARLLHMSPPHKPSSSGKILVAVNNEPAYERYPQVFGLRFERVTQ